MKKIFTDILGRKQLAWLAGAAFAGFTFSLLTSVASANFFYYSNDSGVYSFDAGSNFSGNVTANNLITNSGNNNGLCLWGGCGTWGVIMGNGSTFDYGPVTDYSIKVAMDGTAGRGWTWGSWGGTPVAGLSNTGIMQIAGTFTATGAMNINVSGDTTYQIAGREAMGYYGGWDTNMLYLDGYNGFTDGVSVGSPGATGVPFKVYGGTATFGGNIVPSTASNSGGSVWDFGSSAWGGDGPAVSGIDSVTGLTYPGGSGSQLLTLSSGPGQASLQLDGSIFVGDNGSPYNPIGITGASDGYLLVDNGGSFGGNLYVNGSINAAGTVTANKVTANTFDPVYAIGGTNYATYLPGMTGVKEETAGVLDLQRNSDGTYSFTINFANEPTGGDLWLFGKATNMPSEMSQLIVSLTPSFDGSVWYEKNAALGTLTIHGSAPGEVSYNLTAPRFDASQWTNIGNPDAKGLLIK